MEEILLENMHRNPSRNFSVWDALLYEKVKFQENITLLLNCACCDAKMDGSSIKSVTGFQLTTYTWYTVEAKIFADCSGDSILAGLTGAEYMVGREDKAKFGESMAPDVAAASKLLKEFMFENVYTNPIAKSQEHKAEALVKALYEFFLENANALPAEYQAIAMRDGLDRAVCDYISGMSDRYAIKLYNDYFVPKGWNRE